MPQFDPQYYWAAAGIVLILIEIGFFGFGFLFLGIGCLLSYIFIQFNLIEPNIVTQFAICGIGTVLSWILLWKPLKRIMKSENKEYTNMVGKTAKTTKHTLHKNMDGEVIWSGVKMKAQIDPEANLESIPPNSDVKITSVKGNTLLVTIK